MKSVSCALRLVNSSHGNQPQCTDVSDTGVEVLVARPLMEIQCSKEDRGRGGGERGRMGGVGGCNGSERRGVQGLDTLSDSLSMQITTITGNAWALAPANCHSNNKGGLPLSGEAN